MSSRTISLALTTTGTVDCQNTVTTQARVITRTSISNSDSPYSISSNNYLIGCQTSTGAITVILPAASGVTNQVFYIVDETGNAPTNNITISTTDSETINGDTSKIIAGQYTSLKIYSNGTNYNIM